MRRTARKYIFNFQYEKRFNCFVDVNAIKDLGFCNEELNFSLKDKLKLEKYIKTNKFSYDLEEKRNIGSKKVIEITKNAFKMLSVDLKKNEISEKTSADLSKIVEQMNYLVKSIYGLKYEDINRIIYITL